MWKTFLALHHRVIDLEVTTEVRSPGGMRVEVFHLQHLSNDSEMLELGRVLLKLWELCLLPDSM